MQGEMGRGKVGNQQSEFPSYSSRLPEVIGILGVHVAATTWTLIFVGPLHQSQESRTQYLGNRLLEVLVSEVFSGAEAERIIIADCQ